MNSSSHNHYFFLVREMRIILLSSLFSGINNTIMNTAKYRKANQIQAMVA